MGDNISGDAQTKTITFQTAMTNVPNDMYTFTLSKNIKDLKGSHNKIDPFIRQGTLASISESFS